MNTTKKDYYEILGVARDADDSQIKTAYRKLARKYHPDFNPGDSDAEARFKLVAEAFAVLSDKKQRAKYDRGGSEAFGPGFDPFHGAGRDFDFSFGFQDLADLFGGAFTGGGPRTVRPRRGQDLESKVRISFNDAVHGTTLQLGIDRSASAGAAGTERVTVRIPAGVADGDRIRVSGKGGPGMDGGPAGNIYLRVAVDSHPLFERDGTDLICDVPIGPLKATLGGTADVPTLDGRATIQVPPGTCSGQRLRLKGRGVPASGSRGAGDLYAVIQIRPPGEIDDESRESLQRIADQHPDW